MQAADSTGKSRRNAEHENTKDTLSREMRATQPPADPKDSPSAREVDSESDESTGEDSQPGADTSETSQPPGSYPETRVVLMPVEPAVGHVYWDLSPDQSEKGQPVLRFHDVTTSTHYGEGTQSYVEVDISRTDRNYYARFLNPGNSYFVELGFRIEGEGFASKARSKVVSMPIASPLPQSGRSNMVSIKPDMTLLPTPKAGRIPLPSHTASKRILELSPDYHEKARMDEPHFPGFVLEGGYTLTSESAREEIQRSRAMDSFEGRMRGMENFGDIPIQVRIESEKEFVFGDIPTLMRAHDLTDMSEMEFVSGGVVSS